jgi:hypothetical protein
LLCQTHPKGNFQPNFVTNISCSRSDHGDSEVLHLLLQEENNNTFPGLQELENIPATLASVQSGNGNTG